MQFPSRRLFVPSSREISFMSGNGEGMRTAMEEKTTTCEEEWSIKSSALLEVHHCLHSLCRSSCCRLALCDVGSCHCFIRSFCTLHRVAMTFARLSLCVLLLLPFWNGVHGARMLTVRVQGELPPCKDVPGGVPNWDCYDPPLTPLPPCDFNHQNPGIDCSVDSQIPPSPKPKAVTDIAVADASTHDEPHHVQGMLRPCKDVSGGVQNWDCYDPPSTPLPPCDFKHQNPGIDCSVDSQNPPPPKVKAPLTGILATGSENGARHVQGMLPPCKDVPGGVQNWDCYDPPNTPLPPCDFKHQNPGIDCSTDSQNPPAPKPHHF